MLITRAKEIHYSFFRSILTFFSRLEIVVRPFGPHHVLDIAAKGTVRNKEIFNRTHYRPLAEVELTDFKSFVDLWVPQYAEKFAAS